jgi:glycosyltransferase involved in cell wall biosynthesis
VLAVAREASKLDVDHRHTLAVLDPPVAPAMFMQARRLGIQLVIGPDPDHLRGLVADSDVVQVHYWNHPALTALLRDVELPPARVVVWCHVLGTHAPQVLTADVATFGDRLIVTTEQSAATEGARAAVSAGVPVDVVPGVTDRSRLDGFAPRGHEGCVVGYLGLVNDAKMHPRFAELCAAVSDPNVRFVVYGGGGGEEQLTQRLAAAGIADRAEVRGHTEDVRAALEEMDVFGYPLARETYATSEMTLQEAMWVGIPPVVFAHGGPSSMVTDGVSGLVVSDDRGYARAVDRLAGDPQLRARLGEGARRHARSNFDPARLTATVVGIMEDLMARPRRIHAPMPGAGDRPAAAFVRSLGGQAGPFVTSVAGPVAGAEALAAADRQIAASSTLLARGEGGVIHHRNAYPDDPHLRLWSGLIAAGSGDDEMARSEYRATEALGLADDRPARYAAAGAR